MINSPPDNPKIYYIVHIDNLASIIQAGFLFSDAYMRKHQSLGTIIGMSKIKERRLTSSLMIYPDLMVGGCVPFYFCYRSVMLYLLYRGNNPELNYHGGQGPIIHLESNLFDAVNWAKQNNKRWVFTLSNAGSNYFEAYNNLNQLNKIDWNAVHNQKWSGTGIDVFIKEKKQAEFLMEERFSWELFSSIGVNTTGVYNQVNQLLNKASHKPMVQIKPDWYY